MSSPKNVRLFRPTLLCLEDRTTPSAGMLDPTFGIGGWATTRIGMPSDDIVSSTAIDSQGRILVVGWGFNGQYISSTIARFTPSGASDNSFAGTGHLTFDFAADSQMYSVAVDSHDRVVVAGDVYNGSNWDFGVARFNPDGTLDDSFDGDGKQTIDFGASYDQARCVTVDSQDRIVVAGFSGSLFAASRLTTVGALDTTFDGDGKQIISFGSGSASVTSVAVDSLDRVVLAGSTGGNFAVARLTFNGDLDTSFDGDGKQTIDFGANNDQASTVAIDSLNRVVLAGNTTVGSYTDMAVARLTSAGALDSSFDGDGKQTIAFGSTTDDASGVAIDSFDRIVIVGDTIESSRNFAVARLTVGGELDGSFDGDGKLTIDFAGQNDIAYTVAVDSLDRVVVAGTAQNGFTEDFAVARATTTGALDSSFDGDGKVTLALNVRSEAFGRGVAIDSLGRLVVAGYAKNLLVGYINPENYDIAVARYTPAGVLDISFGSSGIVRIGLNGQGPTQEYSYCVAVDSLDRVVIAGNSTGLSAGFIVMRLTSSGALDTNFDGDGMQTVSFGGGLDDTPYSVAVDSLNRIVVAGQARPNFYYDFGVARLTVGGALDTSFNGTGKVRIDFGNGDDHAYGVAIDSLGRIVVAGSASNGSNTDFAVARITDAGVLDTSFDGDGKQTVPFGTGNDTAYGVAVDSLGRIIAAGSVQGASNYDMGVARLTNEGALDASFDSDGKQTIAVGAGDDIAYAVGVDTQLRVVLAGTTNNGSNLDIAAARLKATGELDGNFDSDGKQTLAFGVGDDIAYGVAFGNAGQIIVAGSTQYNGRLFALARLNGDTTTATAQVNDGSVQRSRVTSLTVRFSGQVTFSGLPEQAFTLVRTGGGAVSFTATVSVQNGGTVVLLDHFTGPETEFGSLADGRYTLTALASQISAGGQALDGDADGVAGGNFVFNDAQGLFRLFGDVNGDATVNGFDLGFFRNAFGTQTGDSNYLSYLDLNGDGVINGFDLGQFRTRFGTMLP